MFVELKNIFIFLFTILKKCSSNYKKSLNENVVHHFSEKMFLNTNYIRQVQKIFIEHKIGSSSTKNCSLILKMNIKRFSSKQKKRSSLLNCEHFLNSRTFF